MGLIYSDQLFPRQAFRDLFDMMLEKTSDKQACRMIVDLLALAHDRGCEAEIAAQIEEDMRHKQIPDIVALRARFAPCAGGLPKVEVRLGALAAYNNLLSASTMMQEATA